MRERTVAWASQWFMIGFQREWTALDEVAEFFTLGSQHCCEELVIKDAVVALRQGQ